VVDVGAVARVETDLVHRVGEQLRVDARGFAVAVLVGLDLHECRLRSALQARQRPGVRIGLLELVGGAVRDELQQLLLGRLALDVARQRRPVVGIGDGAQREVHLLRRRRRVRSRDGRVERGLEGGLEVAAQGQQGRLPLPLVGDARQAAVVQLVAEVQRKLQVLIAQRIGGSRQPGRLEGVDGLRESRHQRCADLTPRLWKSEHGKLRTPRRAPTNGPAGRASDRG
jgi:hypothetical protein